MKVNQLNAGKSWWAIFKSGELVTRISNFCKACIASLPSQYVLWTTLAYPKHWLNWGTRLSGWPPSVCTIGWDAHLLLALICFFVDYSLQLKLMQSELNVEEVVNDRSWKVLSHLPKCCGSLPWVWTVLCCRCGADALGGRWTRDRWGQHWGKKGKRSVIFLFVEADTKASQLHCEGKKCGWFSGEEGLWSTPYVFSCCSISLLACFCALF